MSDKNAFTPQYPGFLTRDELAGQLGVSVHEIRRREGKGMLAPVKRLSRGIPLYSPETVDNQPKKRKTTFDTDRTLYTSDDGKKVFALLASKTTLVEIVLSTGFHPATVQSIAEDYAEMSDAIILTRDNVTKINRLTLDGNFPLTNGDDLVSVLETCAETRCTNCNKRSKSICTYCASAVSKKHSAL